MTDEQLAQIATYNKERNEMLLKNDPNELIEFSIKYKIHVPSCYEVAEIELHKCRTAIRALPMDARIYSKKWLLARGYTAFDDGDVPT